ATSNGSELRGSNGRICCLGCQNGLHCCANPSISRNPLIPGVKKYSPPRTWTYCCKPNRGRALRLKENCPVLSPLRLPTIGSTMRVGKPRKSHWLIQFFWTNSNWESIRLL